MSDCCNSKCIFDFKQPIITNGLTAKLPYFITPLIHLSNRNILICNFSYANLPYYIDSYFKKQGRQKRWN